MMAHCGARFAICRLAVRPEYQCFGPFPPAGWNGPIVAISMEGFGLLRTCCTLSWLAPSLVRVFRLGAKTLDDQLKQLV